MAASHRGEKSDQTSPAILVTGGSGYVGFHLVRHLAQHGEVVVSMYRNRLPEPYDKVYPVYSDLTSVELLAAPLRGVKTVVHMAWNRNFLGPTKDEAAKAHPSVQNGMMTVNLVRAMEKAGTERIIFLSAIGVHRGTTDAFLREKYEAESIVLNSQIKEKIILRTSVIFGGEGNEGKFLNAITKVMRFPGIYPLPRSKAMVYPLHVDDLISVLAKLTRVPMAQRNALLDLAGGEAYRVDELFKLVSEFYVKGRRLPLGSFIGDSLLPFFEKDHAVDQTGPKIKNFLSLGSVVEQKIRHKNPIMDVVPSKFRSFKETLIARGPGTTNA